MHNQELTARRAGWDHCSKVSYAQTKHNSLGRWKKKSVEGHGWDIQAWLLLSEV